MIIIYIGLFNTINETSHCSFSCSQVTNSFMSLDNLSDEELLQYVIQGYTVPIYRCNKFVRSGGKSCTRRPDGIK